MEILVKMRYVFDTSNRSNETLESETLKVTPEVVSEPAQLSEEELQAEGDRQRQSADFSNVGGSCSLIGEDALDPVGSPPPDQVNTVVKIVPGVPFKANRPKPDAFGELPPQLRVRIPVDFVADEGRSAFAHPLVIKRLALMNEAWIRYARNLINEGGALTLTDQTTTNIDNIRVSSAYRPGPTDSSWSYGWLLKGVDSIQRKLSSEARSNQSQFLKIRSGNGIDPNKSVAIRRFRSRYSSRKPSSLQDKQFLFDGYLIDRYGTIERGRTKIAFYSNHASGLAIDIGSGGLTSNSSTNAAQQDTTLFKWLKANAHLYGFTPYKNNPRQVEEAWHWEFLPTREAFFTNVDFVQDGNFNVRVQEQGTQTGVPTTRYDEQRGITSSPVREPFSKEVRASKIGV